MSIVKSINGNPIKVDSSGLDDNAVTTAKIADGAVTSAKLSGDAISGINIADGTISTAKLADGAVTTGKLAAGAVTAAKVGSGAVGSAGIADGAVTTAKLGNTAVTTAKLANGSVTAEKLGSNIELTPQDNSVTTAKVANGAITDNKLSPSGVLAKTARMFGNTSSRAKSGALVSVRDAYGAAPLGVTVCGKSVQGGAPSPESPARIDSISSVSIRQSSKNLLWWNGIGVRKNKYIVPNKTVVNLPAGTYTFSCKVLSYSSVKSGYVYCYDSRGARVNGGTDYASPESDGMLIITFTTSEDIASISVYYNDSECTTDRHQIEAGESYTGYEQSAVSQKAVSLGGRTLKSLPDGTHDSLEIDSDGSCSIVTNVGSISVSDLTWATDSDNDGQYFYATVQDWPYMPDENIATSALCETLTAAPLSSLADGTFARSSTASDSKVYVRDLSASTVSDFLSRNGSSTFLHSIETPVRVNLSPVTLDVLSSPNASVWSVASIKTTTTLKYEKESSVESNHIEILSPHLAGTSVYVEHGGKRVLFDCGYTSDTERMTDFLANRMGSDRLDAVVITHFDGDHVGGFSSVAPFCNSDTDIFVQMSPTENNYSYGTYASRLATCNQIIGQNNLKPLIVPREGAIYNYGDIVLELHNTTAANASTYDSTPCEATSFNEPRSGLNNYSLISYLDINGFVICYAGDVEAVGQRLNYTYARKCDLAFTPHHISQSNGYLPWWMKTSPSQWLGTTAESVYQEDVYVVNRYVVKLMMYGYINDILMTHNDDLVVSVDYNMPRVIKGESLIGEIGLENLASYYTSFYQILPPTYLYDNPHVLYTMSLNELVAKTAMSYGGTYTLTTSMYDQDMQIRKDLESLLEYEGILSNKTITFTTGRYLTIQIHASNDRYYQRLIVFSGLNLSTKHGVLFEHEGMQFRYAFEAATVANDLDLNEYLSAEQVKRLSLSTLSTITTSDGVAIPIHRFVPSGSNHNVGSGSLSGVASDSDMSNVYSANYAGSTGHITVKKRNLSSGTVSYVEIAAVDVVE